MGVAEGMGEGGGVRVAVGVGVAEGGLLGDPDPVPLSEGVPEGEAVPVKGAEAVPVGDPVPDAEGVRVGLAVGDTDGVTERVPVADGEGGVLGDAPTVGGAVGACPCHCPAPRCSRPCPCRWQCWTTTRQAKGRRWATRTCWATGCP